MVQESTMICVDNSEWMRNGDYIPTRLQAVQDAANMIVQCKLRANPENAVGILTMADEVRVLATMTQENSRLFMKLHGIEPEGKCEFVTGIKVAHLALKHRQNRNHKMRIVLFVGSPLGEVDKTDLTKLAKKLKKEKVQMDIVCFGDPETGNEAILQPIVEVLNGKDGSGSNIIVVGPGTRLTEAVAASPILRGEDGAGAPAIGAGGGFDFNDDEDPDLALALRVSLEEERARVQAQSGEENAPAAPGAAGAAAAAADVMDMDMGAMTEEQQLEWALRMSMQDDAAAAAVPEAMDTETAPAPSGEANLDDLMNDPELLRQMVDELPDGEKKEEEGGEKKQ